MKYLVNRETKEHQIASEIAASSMERYPGFAQDWKLVEADADGWIPWSGGECPLPDGHRYDVKSVRYHRPLLAFDEPQSNYWGQDGDIAAYRPILAEKEKPGNHLDDDVARAINENYRHRMEDAQISARRSVAAGAQHLSDMQDKHFEDWLDARADEVIKRGREKRGVFDRLRQAVEAAESIPAILAEINALLPDGYCVTKREAEPVEDMTDWRNWRDGDLIECVNDEGWGTFQVGGIYKFTRWRRGGGFDAGVTEVADEFVADFRFHSRPAKESV